MSAPKPQQPQEGEAIQAWCIGPTCEWSGPWDTAIPYEEEEGPGRCCPSCRSASIVPVQPEAVAQPAETITRCRHGIRSPHECRDCLQEQDQRWFAGPSQRELESILREQGDELADALEAMKRWAEHAPGQTLTDAMLLTEKALAKAGRLQ
jgi:hypothetical protein